MSACIFDRSRVEFDDLQASRSQPCDQSAVIVTRGLNPDTDDQSVTLVLRAANRRGQHHEAGFGQRELERRDDDLAVVISDQSHRDGLAHVHRYDQTALRIHPTNPGHEPRLQLAIDERHHRAPFVGCKPTVRDPTADRREGEPAWRNPVANQAFDGFDPHTKVVSVTEQIWSLLVARAVSKSK